MLSPENYKLLSIVAALPRKYYPEDQRPAAISADRHEYLVKLQLLEPRMLVSADSHEPLYPNGCVGYYLTPYAEDEIQLYEIEANRKAEQDVREIKERKAVVSGNLIDAAMSALDLLSKK